MTKLPIQMMTMRIMSIRKMALALRGMAAGAVLAAMLTGCAAPSAPPQLLYLRTGVAGLSPAAAPVNTLHWQLVTPVKLPDYLDREHLLIPQGQAGLQALPGYRWAEPLRESVPRVLRHDLATLLGQSLVWTAPVPEGVVIERQLRVEILAFEPNAQRTAVQLHARWILSRKGGASFGRGDSVMLTVPSAPDADSLVAAHRQALWLLAQKFVQAAN